MEKQKLPNATAVLVLGIASILTCCCYGIIGLILGIVAFFNPFFFETVKPLKPLKINGFLTVFFYETVKKPLIFSGFVTVFISKLSKTVNL